MKPLPVALLTLAALLVAGLAVAATSMRGSELVQAYQSDPDTFETTLWKNKLTINLEQAEFDERRKRVMQSYDRMMIECDCKRGVSWDLSQRIQWPAAVDCVDARGSSLKREVMVFSVARCERR